MKYASLRGLRSLAETADIEDRMTGVVEELEAKLEKMTRANALKAECARFGGASWGLIDHDEYLEVKEDGERWWDQWEVHDEDEGTDDDEVPLDLESGEEDEEDVLAMLWVESIEMSGWDH